jgi:CRISPR-associated protein Cas1
MKSKSNRKPRPLAIMLSKRANVFYLEHARVVQMDNRVVYLTEDGGKIERFFNIPERNTVFLLLGKGTSITDAAARKLSESNVMVGFCGSGGSPLFATTDLTFLTPQSEYRPTEYMQAWLRLWMDEDKRLDLGRRLLLERSRYASAMWTQNPILGQRHIHIPTQLLTKFHEEVHASQTSQQLLLAEARWAKTLYALLAKGFKADFVRNEGEGKSETFSDIANSLLDHGNYIAYGYASVALCGLGISFSLPILHGKTRRGALVFDIADLIKDACVMPLAFASADKGQRQADFRGALIELCQKDEILDYLFTFITDCCNSIQ